jgi:hypothetical protein
MDGESEEAAQQERAVTAERRASLRRYVRRDSRYVPKKIVEFCQTAQPAHSEDLMLGAISATQQ